jgi:Mycolic acid cyclopropane synthetase
MSSFRTPYRLVLGPSMTYSCAVWPTIEATVEEAQTARYELICHKFGLREGSPPVVESKISSSPPSALPCSRSPR